MAQFKDALSQLPPFKWRGKQYEISSASYGYRHENAEHPVSFGNVELIEGLGRKNPSFSYTVPMRQGVAVGNFNSFTKLPQLDADMRDRSVGQLEDPIWGQWNCRPVSLSTELDPRSSRDGVDVRIELIWAPEIDEVIELKGGIKNIGQLIANAGKLDAEVAVLARQYDVESPKPSTDALSAIKGVGDQLDRMGEKFGASIDRFSYQVEQIEAVADKLINTARDPNAYGVKRSARKLRISAKRIKERALQSAQTTKQIVVAQNKHVLSILKDAGMTIEEFAQLNAAFMTNPIIPAGSKLSIYG